MTDEVLELLMHRTATLTESALKSYYTEDEDLAPLLDAERYSLLAGGKRIRPLLTLEFCRLFGGREEADGLSSLLRGGALTVATAHAGSPEDLRQRGALRPFFERGCFDAFLGIRREKTGMVYDLHKEDEEVQKAECFSI